MRLYLRSRRVLAALLVLGVLAVGNVLLGGRLFSLLVGGEPVGMPYRFVLVMLSAVTAVGSVASPVPRADRADTGPLRVLRRAHLLLMILAVVSSTAISELFVADGSVLAAVRGGLFWFGAALISTRWARASLAWLLPVVLLVPLIRWGYSDIGPVAWNWAAAPGTEPVAWAVALVSLALGLGLTSGGLLSRSGFKGAEV